MIQANELRIGNLINKHFEEGDAQLEVVTSRTIFDCQVNPTGKFTYTGIILSFEIMGRFGFENCNDEFQHPDNKDFDLMFYRSVNNLWCAYNFALVRPDPYESQKLQSLPICNPFKHVHRLQNLYFSLTGSELVFK